MSGEFAHHFRAIDHPDTLHRSEVNRRAVVDLLPGQDGTLDNVLNVGPVADLSAVAPHFERVLPEESARNHGDDRVILHSARTIHREITAGSRSHSVFLGISLQREFAHQLGPAIGIVGIIRAFGQVFGEIKLFFGVRLQEIRIHAAGRSEHHFSYFGFEGLGKDQSVQEKVRRRAGLVEVHVAAPAVIRGEMENRVDALHGGPGHTWFPQIGLQKIDLAGTEMLTNVVEMAAA